MLPKGVEVKIEKSHVFVKGPKGALEQAFSPLIAIDMADGKIVLTRPDDSKQNRALHGLTRSILANMVKGVTGGFKKTLEINGVGYRASVDGKNLNLQLGYSHMINFPIPGGLKIDVEKQTYINIEGVNKELVGQVAANIRKLRGPEPYKGKGIKYSDEVIRRKAGKAGAK